MPNQDDQLLRQFAIEFQQLSDEPKLELQISSLAAWCILAQLQLAMKHPENQGATRHLAEQFARELQSRVASSGALAAMAERGWHQEIDS